MKTLVCWVAVLPALFAAADPVVHDAGGRLTYSFEWNEAHDGTNTLIVTHLPPQNYFVRVNGFVIGKYSIDELAEGVPVELLPDERNVTVSKVWGTTVSRQDRLVWGRMLKKIPSSLDGTLQPCYFWAPERAKETAVPLIVGLHTWSCDYTQLDHYKTVRKEAERRGWAFVGPNFRGPNETPPACGGDPAVRDIVDAVDYAKRTVKIDDSRVYIIGGSGGGHMTLLMLGRHPEIFAAGSAFCPITDLARWHADSLADHPGRGKNYAKMLEAACGGTPAERPDEYRHRSPLTHLDKALQAGVPAYVATGIHDGWKGSVPVGHAFRAFNALAAERDRVSEADIAAVENDQLIPASLVGESAADPFYSPALKIHFRRTSRNVRLTIFEGGHSGNFAAGFDFLSRQRKGRPADWTLPVRGTGAAEGLSK